MMESDSHRWAGRARRGLLNLAVLIASLLVIELALRLFDPIGIRHFAAVGKYANALEFGAPWGYLHQPGYRGRVQGVDVIINQHGLRSPPTAVAKPAGTRRLMILGDSVVFGWGAPQDSIFAARLQRRFDASGAAVEVIDAGVSSWNTRTEYEWLRARGVAFQPDVVLLMIVGNDADPIYTGHTEVPSDSLMGAPTLRHEFGAGLRGWWQTGYRRSRLLAYVQFARVLARQRTLESRGYRADSPQWRDARLALDGIIRLCKDKNITLVVFLYGDENGVESSGVLRAYRDHLAAHGVPVHLLPPELLHQRRYHNSIVDGHENAAGHAILARETGRVVVPVMTSP